MFSYDECPRCHARAARDEEDARLGAVSGGAYTIDTETGKLNGGSTSSYKYHCGVCGTAFTVHRSSLFTDGIESQLVNVEVHSASTT